MILKSIIDRLNQRIEVSNIFDRIYGLCELTGDKGWIYYIGDGQAIPVTDYDSKQGSLFWAKRGKVNISKIDTLKVSGCKQMYSTKFNLSAYAIVRKSHLPCDGEDAGDWVASRVYKLVSGRDYGFKEVIDVVSYEVIPNGYTVGDKTLPPNLEFATVVIDLEVEIVSGSEDTCYDICNTGDIPLPPDFLPCTPCLTEVAVDGVTITGNGTPSDPLIAVGGGGGGGTLLALPFTTDHVSANGNQYVVGNVVWYNGSVYRCIANNDSILPTNASYWVSLGAGFPLVQQPSNWNATSGNNQILNKPTIPVLPATIVEDVTATSPLSSTGGITPDISISQADTASDGYLSSADWNTFNGKFDQPTGTASDYLDGTGTPTTFPTIPAAQVNSDWNATSGVAEILNKPSLAAVATSGDYADLINTPSIPAAQVNSDWNAVSGVAQILNKPTIPAAQVNSDWNATSGVAQILNKPTLTNGTVTSVSASVPNPANPAFSVIVPNSTTTPSVNITANGTTSQYIRGDGSLQTFPTIPVVTGFVPYTGATNDLDMGTYNVTADHIALNVSPSGAGFVVGATQWNNTIGSSETLLKGGNVTLKNGVDLVARIVNKVTPNTTLTKAAYQAVRVSGATGGRLSVSLAQANTDNNSADTIGLVTETIATNQEGFIITVGQLSDINTTGSLQGETWADGDVLYLSPTTAGQLTNIKPTGATGHIVVMGYVEYAHPNQGSIYVKVMNGWELDELHNVYISGLANNDALIYESSTQLWKNKPIATALGYTPVANTLSISTSSPLSGGGNLTANRTLSIADAAADGATKGAAAFTASDFNASAGVISIDYTNGQAASASAKGFLTSGDWSLFNGKEPAIVSGTTSQYWRGDKSWQTLDKSAVGLGNVDNTSDANKPISTATQTALNAKFNTPSGTTSQYVRGDGTLATFPTIPSGTVTSVGLSMPAAFTVANSPVTTSGTLTVTGAGTTGQYVRGDGSLATFPTIPTLTIYKSTTNQTAVTGNTNNNKVVSVLIPANTIAVGSVIEIKVRVGKTGGNGITTLRVYTNTADSIVSPAPTLIMTSATTTISQNYNAIDRTAIVKTATNTETVQATASIQSDWVIGNATLTSSNIDWTQNQYIIFAIQNGAAADSTTLSYYQIEIK